MTLDDLMLSAIYLACSFILFWIGKLVYDMTTPTYDVKEQLVEKDNTALAVALIGYYFGLVLAIGGVMAGESAGLEEDLLDIVERIEVAGTLADPAELLDILETERVSSGGSESCRLRSRSRSLRSKWKPRLPNL